MNKFEGILIVSDLDGTLVGEKGIVSKENKEAIEYFKSNGGLFTFVTGRPPESSSHIYDAIKPNAPIGCNNGGGLYDFNKKDYLWVTSMPDCALELVEEIDKNVLSTGIHICTTENVYFCKDTDALKAHRAYVKLPENLCDYKDITEPMTKICFVDEDENALFKVMDILHSHPQADEFSFIRSERTFYELLPKGISKATALEKLVEKLGVDPKKTIAIGDNDNDEAMIRAAGVGVAVANASEKAKNAADYITVDFREHAIAKIIDDIENCRVKI